MPEGLETVTFEAMVSAGTGKPFVRMTAALDGEPVFAMNMPPSVCTAMGLRAVQAAIEGERDAGMIAFMFEDFAPRLGVEGDEAKGLVNVLLTGMREHRQQFDAEAGSMRKLADDDPSDLTEGGGAQ